MQPRVSRVLKDEQSLVWTEDEWDICSKFGLHLTITDNHNQASFILFGPKATSPNTDQLILHSTPVGTYQHGTPVPT